MAGKGYQASSAAMQTASKTITTDAQNTQQTLADLAPTQVGEVDFGKKYTGFGAKYGATITEMATAVTNMCGTLTQFGGQIGGAGQSYTSTDHSNQANVKKAGA